MIWWIIPALTGVVGLMLGFAGISRLMKANLVGGAFRAVSGIGFLGVAGVTVLTGLNLQTYNRLTYERDVATVRFDATGVVANEFNATVTLADGTERLIKGLIGDEFEIGARVIKLTPLSNILGYDSIYRLEHIESRFHDRYVYGEVRDATTRGEILLSDPGPLKAGKLAKTYGERFGIDARYGSAAYNPIADQAVYKIKMTQSGLIAEAYNDQARRAIQLHGYPGKKPLEE